MSRHTFASLASGSLAVVGFLLGTVVLAWVPLWQVPIFGYATFFLGFVGLVVLFLVALASGPNMFLGMTLLAIVLNISMVVSGVWVKPDDAPYQLSGDTLTAQPQAKFSMAGYVYPGWWQDDIVVARKVRGEFSLETTLPQGGELNELALEVHYSWPEETYRADLLRGGAVDYGTLTRREINAAVADVLGRHNENRPYSEGEVASIQRDIVATFCNQMAVARPDAPCPTLKVTITYRRGHKTITMTT